VRAPKNFNRPAARVVIERIVDALASGPADTDVLIAATGLSRCRGRDYIRYLASEGCINCVRRPHFIPGGGASLAVWALDPGFVELETLDDTREADDQFARRVIVRTSWPPNHVRMTIDCLLFGVPAALQGAQAC
jgi:hypothetical protein